MVKKLISINIIIFFIAELVIYDWSSDVMQIVHTVALVVLAVAAGITIGGHIGGGKHGKAED